MYSDDYVLHHTIIEIDISGVDKDDYFGDGWALIHLTSDGEYIKGLHYVEDQNFHYTDYIAENDIGENDMIMYGKIEGTSLKIIDLLK